MNAEDAAPDAAEAGEPRIDSRAAFLGALRWGFEQAMSQDARRIVCADLTWDDWPVLDEPDVLNALAGWLRRPLRRLVLLAPGYEALERRCPRFNTWRADWMHAIEAWQVPEELLPGLPTVLVSEGGRQDLSVHLIDAQQWRGRAALDIRRARRWCEELDAVLQRSERTWSVRPLGL